MSATFITWGIPAIVLAAAGLGYVWAWWASRRLTAAYPDSSIAAAYRENSNSIAVVSPPEERSAGFSGVTAGHNKGGFSIQGEVLPEEGSISGGQRDSGQSISGGQRDYGQRPNEDQTNEEQPKGTPASTSRP